jgi:tetratricopeptide (TPR) repeat protein
MKKITLVLVMILLASSTIFAQRREVRNASRNLNRGNIEQAKEGIEKAIEDETTKNEPETWILKSKIFMEIAASEDPNIKGLSADPLNVALDAIRKAEELDNENKNLLDIQQTLLVLSEFFFNAGAISYNANQYMDASIYFEQSYKISEGFGSVDTATLYNSGLSAEIAGNRERAIEIYEIVAGYDYDQPFLYSSLANIYSQKEEYDKASRWIKEGRERYPDNLDLIFSEANIYLSSGNIPEARRVLQLAIERDPENANLHYAFAVNYDQMSRDTTFTKDDREFALNEAIKSYEKAIELSPDYFDAIYNLGALHFNEGIRLFVEAEEQLRKDMNFREYEKREIAVKAKWLEAEPYLEKAKSLLDDDDENLEIVLRSLRELYLRTNQQEKYQEVNDLYHEKFGELEDE